MYYLLPPGGKPATIAPSLARIKRGVGTNHSNGGTNGTTTPDQDVGSANKGGPPYPYSTKAEPGNPTVIPEAILRKFHFTFLIRHPRYSIPSFYRCTVPPLVEVTGFYDYLPSEAGYVELRRIFDYLRETGQIGPNVATQSETRATTEGHADICVVDADDLLDNPAAIIEAYCKLVGLDYDPSMLNWDTEEDQAQAHKAFAKWKGFHDDALDSSELKPRLHVSHS